MNASLGPLVTIVTPTLNQGQFIEATMRSVRGQTYTKFEHIVADAGSSDETLEILQQWQSQYPMRWRSEPDRGMYDGVNKGLLAARGAIHCYLNSDDLFFPWTLQTVVRFFEQHPDVDVVFGDAINVDDVTHREHVRVMPPFDLDRLVNVWPLPQPATFWRSRVTEQLGGFDSTLRYVGDWDFFIRAGQRFTVVKIDEFLAVERRHLASKTLGQADPMAAETVRMLARYGTESAPLRRTALRLSAYASRRAAWVRLLLAISRGARHQGPWANLIRASNIRIHPVRLAAGFVPWARQEWKAGSIDTGVDWLDPK
ncbi:MAG: glycosyltransferase family 2 protein [Chloroflexota bacterium]